METPVARKRGRPRKRRREDEDENVAGDGKVGPESKKQVTETQPIVLLGRYLLKEFGGSGVFLGKVVYYADGLYRVNYEDGDFEDLESREIRGSLLDAKDFNKDLSVRRKKLDALVLKNGGNSIDGSKDRGVESTKGADRVEPSTSNELHDGSVAQNDEGEVDGDSDSSSDSSECGMDRDLGFADEAPAVPPPELPPSSGSIGVPEQYVSHLFSVYGFLRSFSISLFLSPFTLDDFVGSLNCRVPNTLLDAIHLAVMRALRRHLETLSADGLELASKCMRCIDWCLLDTLTWPVYLVQYLTIRGYTKEPEWKGFYDEVLGREYYSLPVGRKLIILQVLCDDILDSAELRAEIDAREESEVGVDCDADDINPPENGPRRVHPRYSKTSACKNREAIGIIGENHMINSPSNSNFRGFKSTKSDVDAANVDVDRNSDECRLCGMDGTLLCCDGCPSAYHTRCIGVMKLSIPEGSWYCPECTVNKIGPTIRIGTSLKGAEIFGIDSYGQVFLGTCNHLLVLKALVNEEPCLRYYNRKDIPKVLQMLCSSAQHGALYLGVCQAIVQYWDIPMSFTSLPEMRGRHADSAKPKEDAVFPTYSLPLPVTDDHNNTASINESSMDDVTTSLETCVNMVQVDFTSSQIKADGLIGSVRQHVGHSDFSNQSLVERSTAEELNSNCNYTGHGNGTRFLVTLSSQRNNGNYEALGKGESNSIDDCVYMGSLYKPQAYLNHYMHGDFASSAAAKLALLSSEETRVSETHNSGNSKKVASENYLQTKAFSLVASRFFWPTSEKKLVEVPRERCGWCLSCKATVSSKRGCMLNHAALSATKCATRILATLRPLKSGEGSLASIATYILYMEESLCGLIVGPFLNASYRKQWRKQVDQASSCSEIKALLLELEENIRIIALLSDWVKLVDDWLVEYSAMQNSSCTAGITQKCGPGRRKKQSAMSELTDDGCHEKSFVWWQGGKQSKLVFQKAILPSAMVKRAARQGGSRKISSIFYTDGSEIPKRSRQLAWRAAVEMSNNASQLALQVRYLDCHVRWSDLVHPEQNLQDGKSAETEASAFRNAVICSKKVLENKVIYGIAFAGQKHLPSRVMKSIIEIEQSQDGQEKFWFHENRVPLYLIKEYERGAIEVPLPSIQEPFNFLPKLQKKRMKAPYRDVFFYLTCKRDNLEICTCISCQMDALLGTAVKCGVCKGFCHRDCTVSSTFSTNEEVEFLMMCKQCYHGKVLSQYGTCNESPTSPLHLQVPKYKNLMAVAKGAKSNIRAQDTPSVTKQATSESSIAVKSRRKQCNWGVIWKKKNSKDSSVPDQNIKDTSIDFRLNNILLKGGGLGVHRMEPQCHLCRKPYRSDLMYICCETCKNWYHADAVKLEESKIFDVAGFKCCKCRRIKSPLCPFTDSKENTQESKKSFIRHLKRENSGVDSDSRTAFYPKQSEIATPMSESKKTCITPLKQESSGVDSDSGTIFYSRQSEPSTPMFPLSEIATPMSESKKTCITPLKHESSRVDSDSGTIFYSRESEPSTPMFPLEEVSQQDDDPLLFPLSRVELVMERDSEIDTEWDNGRPGPQKLPVRRHVKREGDLDDFPGSNFSNAEFYSDTMMENPMEPTENTLYPPTEWDISVDGVEGDIMFDDEGFDYDFEPQTLFTFSELLGADAPGEEPEDQGKFCAISQDEISEQHGMSTSNAWNPMPSASAKCQLCSHAEPDPDLSCQNCGLWVHGHCLPSTDQSSFDGLWKCSQCREWR